MLKPIRASLIAVLLLAVPATAAAQCESGECSPGSRYGRSIKSEHAGKLSRRVDQRTHRGQKPKNSRKAKQKNGADRRSFAVVQIGRRYKVVTQKKLARLKQKYGKTNGKNSKNQKVFKVVKNGIARRAVAWDLLAKVEKKARISAIKKAKQSRKKKQSNSKSSTAPRRRG